MFDRLTPGSRHRPEKERTDDNKATAISFAAYRGLRNLYPDAASKVRLDVALAAALASSRYDPNNVSKVKAAVIGNIAAHAAIDARRNDGWNQYRDHAAESVLLQSVCYPTTP